MMSQISIKREVRNIIDINNLMEITTNLASILLPFQDRVNRVPEVIEKTRVKKVLIVDDEETLTWSMARSLSKDRDKYEVMVANDGKEALGLLKGNKIDLVITDIRMPDINGLDLLLRIKKEYPQTKVIIMTAYGSSDIRKEASRRGSLYYVEKPFEISEIRKIIIDLLGKKKGFQGKVFDLHLTDIIQMNCLGRLTTALAVSQNGDKGVIYLNEGEIIHAECGEQRGTEAFYTILSWQEGEFISNTGIEPSVQTIYQTWEHLLIEAMRRKDENQESGDGPGNRK
jgi:DNA-binding response OmpR family regulator